MRGEIFNNDNDNDDNNYIVGRNNYWINVI